LEVLEECLSVHEVTDILREGPGQIEAAYLNTWDRIQSTYNATFRALAASVLLWVITASRPMTIHELRDAVATDPHTGKFAASRRVPINSLIDVCLGLVYVKEESEIVLPVRE
jgi:ankyrin repeat domain-containing protein 50